MRLASAVRELAQLCFEFIEGGPAANAAPMPPPPMPESTAAEETDDEEGEDEMDSAEDDTPRRAGRDDELEGECRQMLMNLGLKAATELVSVHWNPRLRSTAGYAAYPSWRIELNPRLIGIEGQVARTLRHELAHLVAYHRAGRRRIEPHGDEWRRACCDLGIPGESARHTLPLPRTKKRRNYSYQCPACGTVVGRVRPFKRPTACLSCCRKHSRGAYDARFKFVAVPHPPQS